MQADRHAFAQKLYVSRRPLFLVVAGLVLLFELCMMGWVLLQPGPITRSGNRVTYFVLYASLFSVTLGCLLVLLGCKRLFARRPQLFLGLGMAYACCICLWSAFLSAYSHRNTADISVFLYVCLCVAILVPLRPLQALLLYGGSWGFFMWMLQLYIGPGVDPFSSRLNSAFAALLSICIAVMMQRVRVDDFLNTKTILEQNRQIQQMNARLNAMVTVDELTQIHNRRFMDREFPLLLEHARRMHMPVAMVMLDIDHFKQFNDSYGHQAGDACLYRVADIVTQALPVDNAYFVRYGGEEFLLLLVGLEPEEVRSMAETIRQAIRASKIPHKDSPEGYVTASLGVCCSRGDGAATVSQLVHYADNAMYDAKAAGRNRTVVFRLGEVEQQ